ncbi:MAG: aldehyde dehydrogenase family protein [Betaproteobacteria bacterium]
MTIRLQSFIHGGFRDQDGPAVALRSPNDLEVFAQLPDSSQVLVDEAVADARAAFVANRSATIAQRSKWLLDAGAAIDADAAKLTELIIQDIGKPRRLAHFEVTRVSNYLRACAAEIRSLRGESIPLDAAEAGAGHVGFTRRVPYGVVAAITPFNAPINLLIQKVAPALIAGNAVVVKPHPAGTRVALAVAALFANAGFPAGLFNVITGDRSPALALVAHPQVDAVTFTGGCAGGDALVRASGAKKFVAELGANSANVVMADADVADAARRIASAAFEASGQQCVSAQRVIVAAEVHDAFVHAFRDAASALVVGDPHDARTDVGPMVSMAAADRVMAMLDDAVARGGRYILESRRDNCLVSPGIVAGVPADALLWREEAFGPIAVVERCSGIDDALRLANDTPFGLQGSVFTRSLATALRFADELDVGSLWVNEASRFRLDSYPFGGVKRSGFGREGVRYAIEELSQQKFIGMRAVS